MTRLKEIRTGCGHWVTQRQVAEVAGMSLRTYRSYESGARDINKASAFTVLRLALALTNLTGRKVDIEDLLEIQGLGGCQHVATPNEK